jgi:YVTN family beta-propeller protein
MKLLKQQKQLQVATVIISFTLLAGCTLTDPGVTAEQQSRPISESHFLKQIADIPLPGGSSRFDYQSIDEQTGQLYIAHLGAGRLIVFNTKTRTIVADIGNLPGVHGVLAVPELGRVYASATDVNQVAILDAKTLKTIARIPTGKYPDGLAYSPDDKKMFVSNQFGHSNTVIDAQTNQAIATIDLGGEVGNTQYDPTSKLIVAAVQTRNQLVAVSSKTNQVLGRYDLPGCDHPHGLLIDVDQHRAYVACEGNARVAVVKLPMMQVTSTQSVGDSPDVLALDRGLHRLYVASESGIVSIFSAQGKTLVKLEDVFAAKAHTIAVNQQTHEVYLPLEQTDNQPVLRILVAKHG